MSRFEIVLLVCAVPLAWGCSTPETAPEDRTSLAMPEPAPGGDPVAEPEELADPLAELGDVADVEPGGKVSLGGQTLTSADLVAALEGGDQDPSSLIVRLADGGETAGLFTLLDAMAQALPSETMEEIRLAFTLATDPGEPAPPLTFQGPPTFFLLRADGDVSFSQDGSAPLKLGDPSSVSNAVASVVVVDPDAVFVLVVEAGADDELVTSTVERLKEMKARYVYRVNATGLRTVDVDPDR